MLKNRQNQIPTNNNSSHSILTCLMDENSDSKSVTKMSKIKKQAHRLLRKKQETVKDAANKLHAQSRSFSYLQKIFTRQRRPSKSRSMSQLSIKSCKSITENTISSSLSFSSSSSSITSSTASKESAFSRFVNLFPIKGNNKSTLSSVNKPMLLSKKSLEFEALLEEFPSRTIKASLTPCTAA
ncbi:hypothetical protein INT46_011345 [Mucor plumbeus]|uniref:Uncharacterized protein n=1 Tax=Mucor plumbeus TaxID=97098 RepID=A0A8H7QFS6_9FUNG|nr:hypothetical protein INT46_011345 [Mucor plumbeus]